jgi:hypothetical protein
MIYFLLTTSVINKYIKAEQDKSEYKNAERSEEERKELYMRAILKNIEILSKYPQIKIIIVENNGNGNTYLNVFQQKFGISILYTNYNKHNYYHKGYAEMYDMKAVIKEFNIQDDDMIIKMTGRYHCVTNHFIDIVVNKESMCDAFFKFYNVCFKRYMKNDCILGAFALRAKYLREFEYKDIYLSPEAEMAKFIIEKAEKNELRLCAMEDLLVKCTFAENGENFII